MLLYAQGNADSKPKVTRDVLSNYGLFPYKTYLGLLCQEEKSFAESGKIKRTTGQSGKNPFRTIDYTSSISDRNYIFIIRQLFTKGCGTAFM